MIRTSESDHSLPVLVQIRRGRPQEVRPVTVAAESSVAGAAKQSADFARRMAMVDAERPLGRAADGACLALARKDRLVGLPGKPVTAGPRLLPIRRVGSPSAPQSSIVQLLAAGAIETPAQQREGAGEWGFCIKFLLPFPARSHGPARPRILSVDCMGHR